MPIIYGGINFDNFKVGDYLSEDEFNFEETFFTKSDVTSSVLDNIETFNYHISLDDINTYLTNTNVTLAHKDFVRAQIIGLFLEVQIRTDHFSGIEVNFGTAETQTLIDSVFKPTRASFEDNTITETEKVLLELIRFYDTLNDSDGKKNNKKDLDYNVNYKGSAGSPYARIDGIDVVNFGKELGLSVEQVNKLIALLRHVEKSNRISLRHQDNYRANGDSTKNDSPFTL